MSKPSPPSRRLLAFCLLGCVWILSQACASTGGAIPEGSETFVWIPCSQAGFNPDCSWAGSYPHVRAQHCNASCAATNESIYAPAFIGTCDDSRLEDVCWTTAQNPGCQAYLTPTRVYFAAYLTVTVGEDRSLGCGNTTLSTVVFDATGRVVTMYPGF